MDWDWTIHGLLIIGGAFLVEFTEHFNIGFIIGIGLVMLAKGAFSKNSHKTQITNSEEKQ